MSDLAELIERVERVTGPDRKLDWDIAVWVHKLDAAQQVIADVNGERPPCYTSSLDAVVALIKQNDEIYVHALHELPGSWVAELGNKHNDHLSFDAECKTPALALLLAFLLAAKASERQT